MKIINLLITSFSFFLVDGEKKMDFGVFSMTTPDNWNYIEARGIDSFVGKISLDGTDTLNFDYGNYSNPLNEDLGLIITFDSVFKEVRNENKADTLNPYVMKFYAKRDTLNLEKEYKTYDIFEIVNDRKAKIVIPKKVGVGMIGVYFESVSKKRKGKKLQISGSNLSAKNQEEFLKAIKTIKFND